MISSNNLRVVVGRVHLILLVVILSIPWMSEAAPDQLEGCLLHETDLDQFLSISPSKKAWESACSYARQRCANKVTARYGIEGDKCQQYYDPSGTMWQRGLEQRRQLGEYYDQSRVFGQLIAACADFYKEIVIKDWYPKAVAADAERIRIAEEEKRKAEKEKLRRDEASRREQEREEQAAWARELVASSGEQKRLNRIASLNIAKEQLVVWSGPSANGEFNRATEDPKAFELLNLRFQEDMQSGEPPFTAPSKGEFETSATYTQRLEAARTEHETRVAAMRRARIAESNARLQRILLREFGTPKIGNVVYDADRGRFTLVVAAANANVQLKAQYNVPPDTAPLAKDKLKKGAPNVVFAFSSSRLGLRDMFVVCEGEVLPLQIVAASSPIELTRERAESFRNYVEREKKLKEQEERWRAEENARREAARPKSVSEQIAQALLNAVHPRCQAYGRTALAFGPDTLQGQIMIEKAGKAGCY
jgi:hypothetical protein